MNEEKHELSHEKLYIGRYCDPIQYFVRYLTKFLAHLLGFKYIYLAFLEKMNNSRAGEEFRRKQIWVLKNSLLRGKSRSKKSCTSLREKPNDRERRETLNVRISSHAKPT